MIDETDSELSAWASGVVGGVSVSLALPQQPPPGPLVSLYLLELANAPAPRGDRPAPLRLHLRYLVTTWAERPEEAHRLLGMLVFAALDRGDLEVDLAPLAAQGWTALGLAPRPSFILKAPLVRKSEAATKAALVTQPMVARLSSGVRVQGRVLGPGDTPLVGAWVELPSMGLVTQADHDGRFRFPPVPAESRVYKLRVRAKGHVELFNAAMEGAPEEPITIRMKLEEGISG